MRCSDKAKKIYWITVSVLLILLAGSAIRGQYRFVSWTTDEGLPQNSVYSITQTVDGYLWLTTLDGLVRFDGVKFTVFNKNSHNNLPGNRFTYLFADIDNTLWICTEQSGITRYKNGKFQTYTTAEGLPDNRVYEIRREPDGSLMMLTERGTARWENGVFTTIDYRVYRNYKSYRAPSGNYWELDENGLRKKKTDGSFERIELPLELNEISADRTFNYLAFAHLFESKDGALWLSGGGRVYRLADGSARVYGKSEGLPESDIRVLTADADGKIWVGTRKHGACRLNGEQFECYGSRNGLSSDVIDEIFTDREGTIWIGTNDRGINRVTKGSVQSFSEPEGLADKNVFPILETRDGSVWLGSFSSLSRVRDGVVKNYGKTDGLLYEIVQSLYEDETGRLWVGSVGGIQYYENGKFYDVLKKLNLPVGDFDFWQIYRDRAGVMWFATRKGLIRYENGSRTILTTADGLPNNDVKLIRETSRGEYWIGTYGGVLVTRNGEIGSAANYLYAAELEPLRGVHIRTIYEDEEAAVWIGTYDSGLFRFKDGRLKQMTTADGLFSNGIFQILEDRRGNFWMSGNQGIFRVARRQLAELADGRLDLLVSKVFGKSDGMRSTECNGGRWPAGIVARDGRLWFPTQDGAAIIDPEKVSENRFAPPVVIESATVSTVSLPLDEKVVVRANQGNLEIRYTGLSFIRPEQIQFRYKLEGLDTEWTEAGTRREAYYPYLPPGNYTFRVIAANSDNVWNNVGAALKIEVLTPFYRQGWFISLAVLGVFGFVFYLSRRRIRQLENERLVKQTFSRRLIASQELERKRIAAELHDSLGQRLVVIKNLALMYMNANGSRSPEIEKIEAISAEASEAIGEVKGISYNLRPYQLDRIGLTKAVEAVVATARAASGIEFSADIDDIDDFFPRESEINFYRIVQECVNNTLKHSRAERAFLMIRREERAIELEIADDGVGFNIDEANSKTGGFGLLGIRERAALFGGRVEIKSAPGQGASLRIRLQRETS